MLSAEMSHYDDECTEVEIEKFMKQREHVTPSDIVDGRLRKKQRRVGLVRLWRGCMWRYAWFTIRRWIEYTYDPKRLLLCFIYKATQSN